MRKGWGIVALSLVFVSVLIFFIFPKTGFATASIDASTLENLRQKAEVECLQNSQCSNNSECMNNACVDKKDIDVCQEVSLSTTVRSLHVGDSINSAKKTLSESDLPSLLTDGKLVEIIDGKLIEHLYSPAILLSTSKIESENEIYSIKNNGALYTYRLIFSRGVDFSSKNIIGQSLRILGDEYVIGSNSDNSNIYLVSDNKNILLQNNENIKITNDKEGNVILIDILFYPLVNIKASDNFIDPTFNSMKLSFNSIKDNFADVRFGGNCL
jgi:hypothetical protein